MRHYDILDPPYWEIYYPYSIRLADGTERWSGMLRIFKPSPNACWDGSLPHPVTLECRSFDGDWNFNDFENFNPDADIFK